MRDKRHALGMRPVYKRVDTCAAEFAANTAYMYSTYEDECEAEPTDRKKIMMLGGGPNRIGQGIEFDYCCVHAALALREDGYETIMVNCNPETVSTDYDTSDRLYFEPLTLEDVLEIVDKEKPHGRDRAVRRPDAAEAGAATWRPPACRSSAPRPTSIDIAEDRERFQQLLHELEPARSRRTRTARTEAEALAAGRGDRLPAGGAPELRARRPRDGDRARRSATSSATCARRSRCRNDSPVLLDRFLERRDRGATSTACRDGERRADRRRDGAHRAGRRALGRLGLLAAAVLAVAGDCSRRAEAPDRRRWPRR